jgi:flagellar hook-basal body complex protein FliE
MLAQPIIPVSLTRLEGIIKKPVETADNSANSFGKILENALSEVNDMQLKSAETDKQLAAGTLTNVHQAMITTEKATLALDMAVQVHNKVIDAYQEIMRTQF